MATITTPRLLLALESNLGFHLQSLMRLGKLELLPEESQISNLKTKAMNKKTIYIQRKDGRNLETVNEFDSRKEAREMLKEYRMSDCTGEFYLSSRACKDWHK